MGRRTTRNSTTHATATATALGSTASRASTPTSAPVIERPRDTDERIVFAHAFPVHVGVDTGKSFHKLVAAGPDGRRGKAIHVDVSREGFDAAAAYLAEPFPGVQPSQMLVGLELAGHHGVTSAEYLAARGYHLVHVLPAATKKLKEVEDNSPGKNDVKDAAQICGMLKLGLFVLRYPPSEIVAQMRVLTTERLRLTREETGLKNRLQAVLDVAWPEFMGAVPSLAKQTPRVLLERWPLPEDLLAARAADVRRVARTASRGQFGADDVETLRRLAQATIGVRSAPEARRAEIGRLVARWTLLKEQMADLDARLVELVEQHPATKALLSVPEVQHLCAATIVAELGTPESYVSPRQVLKMAGMNLAGKESGTSVRGRIRQTKRGRPGLRRQLFLLAGRWCSKRGHYRGYYLTLTGRNGQSKISAMCAVARKLVPLLLRVMQTGEPFDLARWQAARRVATGPDTSPAARGATTGKARTRQGARHAATAPLLATAAPVPMDHEDLEGDDTPYREEAMTA